jgi:hypothetical protein
VVVQIRAIIGGGGKKKPGLRIPTVVKRVRRGEGGRGGASRRNIQRGTVFLSYPIQLSGNGESKKAMR